MAQLAVLFQSFALSLGLLLAFSPTRAWARRTPGWVRPVALGACLGALALFTGLESGSLVAQALILAAAGALGGPWTGAIALALTVGAGLVDAEELGSLLGLTLVGLSSILASGRLDRYRLRSPVVLLAALGVLEVALSWLVGLLFDAGRGFDAWAPSWAVALFSAPVAMLALGLVVRSQAKRDEDQVAYRRLNQSLEELVAQRTNDLTRSAQSLRLILDSLTDAVFIYDLDGRIVDVNQRFLELYELTHREQAVGNSPLTFAAPDNRPDLALDPRAEPTLGRTLSFEWQCQTQRTNRVFPAEVQLTRIDYQGAPHLLAVVRDIATRKASEQQLKAYQSQLEDLVNLRSADLLRATERLTLATQAAGIGCWDWNVAARTIYWDDTLLELYGLTRAEFTGRLEDCNRYIPDDDLAELQALAADCLATGKTLECQHRIVRGDGQIRHVRAYGRVVASGEAQRMVGVNYDVTERLEALQALQAERNLAQQYLDVVEVILVALDTTGRITLLNRKGYQVLGYPQGQLEGKSWFETCIATERLPSLQTVFRQLMEGRTTALDYYENEVVTRSGARRLIAWHNRLVHDAQGRVMGLLSSGEDITEKRAAERQLDIYSGHLGELVNQRTKELEAARDAANAANEAKSLFLANMSHEIRTPMNSVLGFAQLLAKEPGLSAEGHHKVETIVRSGEQLLAIINDILEMSRIEAGRLEIKSQPVNLFDLLAEVAQQFEQRALDKGLEWHFERRSDLPEHIITDPVRLRQVLTNLIGNAVKFTEKGSVTLSAFSAGQDRIAVEVTDTGVGIPEAERERLFQPFERTRLGKTVAGGTGLGLAISRRYAQLLGGDVAISGGDTRGTTFHLECDAPPASGPVSTGEGIPDLPVLHSTHWGTLVLVVDDMRANRELLRGMLEPLGFEVLEAVNGVEAVRLVDLRRPRLVLMDLLMPGMDGYEATRQIRQSHPRELVTVIGVTASAFEKERTHFESSGLDGFLAKPFRFPDLQKLISECAHLEFEHPIVPAPAAVQTHAPLPVEWAQAFRSALAQGNITRLRQLGEDARGFDPLLAGWVAERAARYELDELRGFLLARGEQP